MSVRRSIAIILVVVTILAVFFLSLGSQNNDELEGVEVLALLAEGFDYKEFTEVKTILGEKGAIVTAANFSTEKLSGDGGSYTLEMTFDEVNAFRYDVFFIPGGEGPFNLIHSPDNIRLSENHKTPVDILVRAHIESKYIAAICHGPLILAASGIVNGTRVTCYFDPHMVAELESMGALVETNEFVIRDGRIITGNGWDAIKEFASEIVDALING